MFLRRENGSFSLRLKFNKEWYNEKKNMLDQRFNDLSKVGVMLVKAMMSTTSHFFSEFVNVLIQFKSNVFKELVVIKNMVIVNLKDHLNEKITLRLIKEYVILKGNNLLGLIWLRRELRDLTRAKVMDVFFMVLHFLVYIESHSTKAVSFLVNWLSNEREIIVRFFSTDEVDLRVKRKAVFILMQIYIPFLIFVGAYILHFYILQDMVLLLDVKAQSEE